MAKNNKKITKSVSGKSSKPAKPSAKGAAKVLAKKTDTKNDKKHSSSKDLAEKNKKQNQLKSVESKKGSSPKQSEKLSDSKKSKTTQEAKLKTSVAQRDDQLSENGAEKKSKKGPKKTAVKTPAKGEELDLDTDFLADDDGVSEIDEYAEELKEVEALDEVTDDEDILLQETKEIGDEEVYLTDAEGRRYCRSKDCDQIATVDAYCRYHYLLFWKKIQIRKKILTDGKLERYIEELTSRYPDKFLEMIRRDLRTEKDFVVAIQELEIDESGIENDFEEDTQSYIEEVRGLGETTSTMDEEDF